MSKSIQIKKTEIGNGIPKICVPVTGKTQAQIEAQVQNIIVKNPDLVEWRADYFEAVDNHEAVLQMLREISDALGEIPLLFTFRTAQEGGERPIAWEEYVKLNSMVAASGAADLIDVEAFFSYPKSGDLIACIHQSGVSVIGSNHHFHNTPTQPELLDILQSIDQAGADILKVAVMPEQPLDVLTLLEATELMHQRTTKPLITMAMGGIGTVSRISGECFGSAVTFGCVDEPSAPGQMEIAELQQTLAIIHKSMRKS